MSSTLTTKTALRLLSSHRRQSPQKLFRSDQRRGMNVGGSPRSSNCRHWTCRLPVLIHHRRQASQQQLCYFYLDIPGFALMHKEISRVSFALDSIGIVEIIQIEARTWMSGGLNEVILMRLGSDPTLGRDCASMAMELAGSKTLLPP